VNVALRPKHLNIISLCTGGAGLDLGIELAVPSARTVCMVEREAFGVATLVSAMEKGLLHPAPIWSNARTFDGRPWRGAVDGVVGGIPCQPHSLAGKRLGAEDERDLWSTARRIIVQSGAWFVLIENVRGMLSSGGAERVWRDLHRLGFEVEGGLFTAAEVGASHERERLFILAVADRVSLGRQEGAGHGAKGHRATEFVSADNSLGMADAIGSRLQRRTGRQVRDQQPTIERGGEDLVDSASVGCGEGWPEPELRSGRHSIASTGATVDNTVSRRRTEGRNDHGEHERDKPGAASELAMDDASIARSGRVSVQPRRQVEASSYLDRASLFPPRPNDFDSWRSTLEAAPELEPAFRRVADGLASRLDVGRVDRLRMLGNGVVSLEAAYAWRTLVNRLAARGSAAAVHLVRMMEAA
jgi:DNA (cytosine-5)-methyltransferase 1